MVDFNRLNSARSQSVPTDPLRIFQRLPKPPHINDLWESQSEALKTWTERRIENDLVIKLNTGGGKTLVGLLVGQALLNELHQPVLYLCPNKQLVRQTVAKGQEVGLATQAYEPGPGSLPSEFLNATLILVATYNALFHGRSKFGVSGSGTEPVKIGGIICDDAHASFSTVRDAFSISITSDRHSELYKELVLRFRADFERIGKIGSYDDIVERGDPEVLEVPYSAWLSQSDAIRQLLARKYTDDFKYELPLLRDSFSACHALISARDFSITAIQPLTHLLPSFADCRRRVYMSATIADDSSLIRTFDANPKTVGKPIIPESLAGIGERMILALTSTKLPTGDELTVAKDLASKVAREAGVVILVPSEKAGKRWDQVGQVMIGDQVDNAVENLRSRTQRSPIILANRYDGIDLIGDACRLLIMDGLPKGANTYEIFRAEVLQGSSSLNLNLAQKVEQGMGRATRGAGDYCVVLLVGSDLVSWATRSDSLNLMTPSTRTQLRIGHDICESINDTRELYETVQQCLKRDPAWTKYHAETLADRAESPQVDTTAIRAASVEREYAHAFVARDYVNAAEMALGFANEHQEDKRLRGWFLQLAARARHHAQDLSKAEELQRKAFTANPMLWAPPGMAPLYMPTPIVGKQAENINDQIAKFSIPTGHLQDFIDSVSWLMPAATSNQLEEGLKRLGSFLGFHGERPEKNHNVGPDILWLPDEPLGILIESKGNKQPQNALGKSEHGQLLVSAEWFSAQYPQRTCVRVQFHPNDKATPQAMAQNTFVLTFESLDRLVSAVRSLLNDVCHSTLTRQARLSLCEELLTRHKLRPHELIKEYFAKFNVIE